MKTCLHCGRPTNTPREWCGNIICLDEICKRLPKVRYTITVDFGDEKVQKAPIITEAPKEGK